MMRAPALSRMIPCGNIGSLPVFSIKSIEMLENFTTGLGDLRRGQTLVIAIENVVHRPDRYETAFLQQYGSVAHPLDERIGVAFSQAGAGTLKKRLHARSCA